MLLGSIMCQVSKYMLISFLSDILRLFSIGGFLPKCVEFHSSLCQYNGYYFSFLFLFFSLFIKFINFSHTFYCKK